MILRRVWIFLNVDLLYGLVSFVNSILTVRLMGADLFGKFSYLQAILALIPSFYSVFDNTLVRFIGGLPARRQKCLLLFVLVCKMFTFVISGAGLAIWYFAGKDVHLHLVLSNPAMVFFAVAAFATLPMELVSRSLEASMQSMELYRRTLLIKLSQAGSLLALNFILWISVTRGDEVLVWRAALQFISGIGLLAFGLIALQRAGWWSKLRKTRIPRFRSTFKYAYRAWFRPYSQPMTVGILFEYGKSYLPSLLLAHMASFESVAYYRVFKNAFEFSKKTLPKVAGILLPSVVKLKQSNMQFEAKYSRYSRQYLSLIGIISIGTFILHPIILRVFHLGINREASWTSLLFSICLLVATLGFILNYLILLEKDTSPQYYIASVGGTTYIALLILLSRFGMIGTTLALLCKGVVTNLQYQYYVVHKHRYMTASNYWLLTAIMTGFCILLAGSTFLFPHMVGH